jgi:hypothetical protein
MISSKPEIKPSTADDIASFYGAGVLKTVRAYSVFWRGELVAVAGVMLEPTGFIIFSDMKEGIEAPKMTVWKTAKLLAEAIKKFNIPAYTAPCKTGKFLESIGLKQVTECNGEHIYRI